MADRYGVLWPAVHNSWVLTWAEQGTLGFLLWVAVHVSVLRVGIQNLRIRDPMMHALGAGLLAGFVAIMIDGLASFFVRTEAPGRLFLELIPFYVFKLDHAHHAGFEQRLMGNWDLWMNVINAEADHGADERALFAAFYGVAHDFPHEGWQAIYAFSAGIMRPLDWAGLLARTPYQREGKYGHHVFKTPLWRSALKLNTDAMLRPVSVQ